MFQLRTEALIQYEELEALLPFSPTGLLPDTNWPLEQVPSPSLKSKTKKESLKDKDPPDSIVSSSLPQATQSIPISIPTSNNLTGNENCNMQAY